MKLFRRYHCHFGQYSLLWSGPKREEFPDSTRCVQKYFKNVANSGIDRSFWLWGHWQIRLYYRHNDCWIYKFCFRDFSFKNVIFLFIQSKVKTVLLVQSQEVRKTAERLLWCAHQLWVSWNSIWTYYHTPGTLKKKYSRLLLLRSYFSQS